MPPKKQHTTSPETIAREDAAAAKAIYEEAEAKAETKTEAKATAQTGDDAHPADHPRTESTAAYDRDDRSDYPGRSTPTTPK